MQANSISNAYRACFCENKVQEKGVPDSLVITILINRPSFFQNCKTFNRHSTPTSCKILEASCYGEQPPTPVPTAPSQKEFIRNIITSN